MQKKEKLLHPALVEGYAALLRERERSAATVQKYVRDLNALRLWLEDRPLTKETLLEWRARLTETHSPASVNATLAAVNGFLRFLGREELTVRPLKLQRSLFLDENRELTRSEYVRLVRAAEHRENRRLALVLQTLCTTGIRVSELQFITVQAVETGRAEVDNKGKRRVVFLPEKLRRLLKTYLRAQKKTAGAVFTTRTGKPLDRSNIWRDMKTLCQSAGVRPGKVFPHNLRHLFARTYYAAEKDLSRLADLLGHSSVNTTRVYTAESGAIHARQVERLGLVLTT